MSNAYPLSASKRLVNYYVQTGRRTFTPRQMRRIVHKANHARAPFARRLEIHSAAV